MDLETFRRDVVDLVGADAVTFTPDHDPDDLHDESLHLRTEEPYCVVRPASTAQVQGLCVLASQYSLPITPRGSGTGLSGAASAHAGGVVISFARMNRVLRVNIDDHVAVVQPGVTLGQLDEILRPTGLRYPVYPGELSGSIGGNVNTNAGGMRAVRHGVTRHHVLALELVLVDGTVVRSGAPVVKASSGYDLTQLVIGSEGTLALVTEVTLKLSPAMACSTTVLVPFAHVDQVASVVPAIVASGLEPSMLEYLDVLTMKSIAKAAGLELGVAPQVAAAAAAYLVVVLETRTEAQLEGDVADLAAMLVAADALEVYVLGSRVGTRLVEARERAFWVAKAAGANDIVDVVVPRSRVPQFLAAATRVARTHDAFVAGCGHVGDGNVHLSIYQPDERRRNDLLLELFALGLEMDGQISGEHGIGRDKLAPFLALSDPSLLDLQRRIKQVFDPRQLLNPPHRLDDRLPA